MKKNRQGREMMNIKVIFYLTSLRQSRLECVDQIQQFSGALKKESQNADLSIELQPVSALKNGSIFMENGQKADMVLFFQDDIGTIEEFWDRDPGIMDEQMYFKDAHIQNQTVSIFSKKTVDSDTPIPACCWILDAVESNVRRTPQRDLFLCQGWNLLGNMESLLEDSLHFFKRALLLSENLPPQVSLQAMICRSAGMKALRAGDWLTGSQYLKKSMDLYAQCADQEPAYDQIRLENRILLAGCMELLDQKKKRQVLLRQAQKLSQDLIRINPEMPDQITNIWKDCTRLFMEENRVTMALETGRIACSLLEIAGEQQNPGLFREAGICWHQLSQFLMGTPWEFLGRSFALHAMEILESWDPAERETSYVLHEIYSFLGDQILHNGSSNYIAALKYYRKNANVMMELKKQDPDGMTFLCAMAWNDAGNTARLAGRKKTAICYYDGCLDLLKEILQEDPEYYGNHIRQVRQFRQMALELPD